MEKKILDRISEEGLSPTDLTKEELDLLRDELKAEERGDVILDGVLSPINIVRIMERKYSN